MRIRHISTKEAKNLIKNKFWKRVSVLSILMIPIVLVDEYISQGYIFNPGDVTKVGTHESLIIILVTISLISTIIDKNTGGG